MLILKFSVFGVPRSEYGTRIIRKPKTENRWMKDLRHDCSLVANQLTGRPAQADRRAVTRPCPGNARRDGARPQHSPGSFRQQSWRHRAVPGPAPDLRFPPRPSYLGYWTSNLST